MLPGNFPRNLLPTFDITNLSIAEPRNNRDAELDEKENANGFIQ